MKKIIDMYVFGDFNNGDLGDFDTLQAAVDCYESAVKDGADSDMDHYEGDYLEYADFLGRSEAFHYVRLAKFWEDGEELTEDEYEDHDFDTFDYIEGGNYDESSDYILKVIKDEEGF